MKPIMPILKQVYKIINIIEAATAGLQDVASAAGVNIDEKLLNIINTVTSGLETVKSALEKIISFFGGDLSEVNSMAVIEADKEIQKLKDLI